MISNLFKNMSILAQSARGALQIVQMLLAETFFTSRPLTS